MNFELLIAFLALVSRHFAMNHHELFGVVDIVGGDHRPEAIPDEEIAAIKTVMTSVLPYDPIPYLHEGMHGILLRKEKRHRLVLGVRLIQQAAAVEIDVNDVVPA